MPLPGPLCETYCKKILFRTYVLQGANRCATVPAGAPAKLLTSAKHADVTSRSPNPSPGANYGPCKNLIPNTTFEKPYDSTPFQPAARPVDKITTVPKSKVGERVGRLDDEDIIRLNQAMMVFLGLTVSPRMGREIE